ncbi:MAG: OmpH family outer membrane protein [Bacteroidota bacterium]
MNEESNNNLQEGPKVIEEKKECCTEKKCRFSFWINIICLAGVIALFILFFLSKKQVVDTTPPKTIGNVTFAFVNTDSLMAHYDFVLDVQVDLAKYEKILQNQYTATVTAFQKEYDDYIKRATAGLLTLDQQKKTEETLGKKQQSIGELEGKLAAQLQEEKLKRNMEVHDSIVNHIARYNKTKNYTFIFEQSYGGGLLFAHSGLDITPEILKGLNEEYTELQKKKKSESGDESTTEKK